MRRDLLLILLLGASACAYYNGLYNAGGLVKRAESAARDGKDSVAVAAWREAAAKADTVVTRYPKSRWTDDALLVSGTSSALAGECAHGLERLSQWERHAGANAKHRVRATIARGACLVRRGEFAHALDTLGPVITHRDETLSRIAAAWAARAALGAGRPDSVIVLASKARSDALDAELAAVALSSNRVPLAERILRQRAGEWRSLAATHVPLDMLARVDRLAAERIVQLAQESRAPRLERARLSLTAGSWSEQEGDVRVARLHYERALRMSSDTALVTDAATRLGLLDVRTAATLGQAQALLERARGKAIATSELARVDSALRLATRLANAEDTTAASLFLAAEVARDAVGAIPLARALFLRAVRERPTSSLAPKALLAAAALAPDSARVWRAQVLARYADSPYARALEGKAVPSAALATDERLLRLTWSRATSLDSGSVSTVRRIP